MITKTKKGKCVGLMIPTIWIEALKEIARNRSLRERRDIEYTDIIRESLMERYPSELACTELVLAEGCS